MQAVRTSIRRDDEAAADDVATMGPAATPNNLDRAWRFSIEHDVQALPRKKLLGMDQAHPSARYVAGEQEAGHRRRILFTAQRMDDRLGAGAEIKPRIAPVLSEVRMGRDATRSGPSGSITMPTALLD